jgi:hypothetical protein
MSTDPWDGLVYGSPEFDTMDRFYEYVDTHFNTNPFLALGTYTLVFKEYVQPGGIGFYQKIHNYLASLVIPTVYAQTTTEPNTYTITFTLAKPVVPPAGASSVLFLPGIQASRLYTGGILGTEDQLWEPSNNEEVQTLALSENGTSIIDIRTQDIIDEAAISFIGGNIYKGFINFMDDLVESEIITAWQPFAYDWRYDVFDIVENGT